MLKFFFRFSICLALLGKAYASSDSTSEKTFKDNFCGMLLVSNDKGHNYSTATLIATYKGAKEESIGLFVTAAHAFLDEKLQVKKKLQATLFLDKNNLCTSDEDERRIQSKRAPIMKVFVHKSMREPNKYVGIIGDIALAIASLPKLCPIQPIALYNGTGYLKKKNIEGLFVTYGRLYGPNATKILPMDYKRKAGLTKVTFYNEKDDLYGSACFRTFLDSTLSFKEMKKKNLKIGFTKKAGTETITLAVKNSTKTIYLSPHEKQVNFTKGTSGGALIFKTSKGFALAGIFSQIHTYQLVGVKDESYKRPLIIHKFEAIPTYKWIHEYQKEFSNGGTTSLLNNLKKLGLTCLFETPHKAVTVNEILQEIDRKNYENFKHKIRQIPIKEIEMDITSFFLGSSKRL